MYDLSQNYDSYVAILNDRIYTDVALLILLFGVVVGIAFGVVWFIRWRRNNKNTMRESIEIIVCFSLLIVALVGATISTCRGLADACYDKEHQAYEIIEAPFRLKKQEYGWGIRRSEVHSVIYEQNGEYMEVDVETFYCNLEQGRYTDVFLVYGARSKLCWM